MQSTHSFARVQTEYFLLQGKSSLLIFHFKYKYCLVVQHRKHETETKGETGIRVTRHCSTLCSVRKMPCFVLFFFFFSSILLFSLFSFWVKYCLSDLPLYKPEPGVYFNSSLPFFQVIEFRRLFNTKGNSKTTQIF